MNKYFKNAPDIYLHQDLKKLASSAQQGNDLFYRRIIRPYFDGKKKKHTRKRMTGNPAIKLKKIELLL